jgi:hypothetical protein
MRRAMTIAASYLPDANERDPTHYVTELSRRARGFAMWAIIRALGRTGIAEQDATFMAGGTDWRGRHVMRLSVMGGTTHEVDGARSAEAIVSAWRTVRNARLVRLP